MTKWNERLQTYLTPKNLAYFLTAVYLLSLIPLLVLGHYNYPSADDYSEAFQAHRALVETHSVGRAFLAAASRSVRDYFEWMGYVTCNFLMAFSPTVFDGRAYVLTSYLILGMLSFSTAYFLNAVFVKAFRGDRYVSLSITMLTLLVTVQCMVGRVEAFYWYSGAANYILVHCFSLLFYGLLVSYLWGGEKGRKRELILSSILGFATALGNQMTALNGAIVLAVGLGFFFYKKYNRTDRKVLIPIAVYYVGFLLNVAAPGNFVRAESQTGMNPVKAIFVSLYYGLDYCVSDWTTWPVLLAVLLMVPLFWKLFAHTEFSFSYPGIVLLFGYGLFSAMMTPPLFALGNIGAGRLQALTFTMYILVLTLSVGYLTGWVKKRLFGGRKQTAEPQFSKASAWYILLCLLFLAFGSVLSVIPDAHYYSVSSAMTDLRNGSAKSYAEALKEREALYLNSEADVVVKPLPAQPELLYFSDITTDPEDWQNLALARFYGLSSVRLSADD